MAWSPESSTRDNEHPMLPQFVRESNPVLDGRFREHVECPLWLDDLVPDICQVVMQEITLGLLLAHVDRDRLQILDDVLHQSRCINEAKRTVAEC